VNAAKFISQFGWLLFLHYLSFTRCARFEWWWAMAYSIVFIIGPFVLIFLQLYKAKDQKDYHRLSNWTKLVMLTGILSMVFFYFYL
jgi:4-hydroxybenzoate polyprenyltransferase